jgi:hypothetical protein
VTEQNTQYLVLFGDVSTKEFIGGLGVCGEDLLVLKANWSDIRVPKIQKVNDVDVNPSQCLRTLVSM